jgi:rubrerythrin
VTSPASISFGDILEMAITLEVRGATFYSRAEMLSRDPVVRRFFRALVEVEERHEIYFRKMRAAYSGSGSLDSPHDPGGERARRIQQWVGGQLFDRVDPARMVQNRTLEQIVAMAIGFEEQSAEFYERLKFFVTNPEDSRWIDKVAHEERTHAQALERIQERIRART